MTENEKNYFFWNERSFEDAVRETVCPQCPYFGSDCKNPDTHGCALFRYLPELVRIAQKMEYPDAREYAREVEKEIPFHCEWTPSPGHTCHLLDSPRCGLDKLLPFILEAVVKADRSLEAKPNFRS